MSDALRWKRLGDLLAATAERPTAERAAYLESACPDPVLRREAEQWAAVHREAAGFLEDSASAWLEPEGERPHPAHIGSYRVLAELGQGGMGTVYLALDQGLGSGAPVALKVLRSSLRGAQWRRRFETERQVLLSLNHPYIARLLDAGEGDDGAPYLVLEYVAGSRLLNHCHERELDTRARLHLFGKVCEAVQHAHQNLVLHRDLKPANVLVDERGDPKLLDFGLAKLLRAEAGDTVTAAERRPLTPGYASPEQLRAETMTTASDVFALGVVLHELLTGVRPFADNEELVEGLLRAIHTGAPALPGTLRSEPDLDAIVRKALRFDPAERYATALELREDLQRYLAGRPVKARATSRTSRCVRFLRRHRAASGLSAALVVVASAAGVNAWRQHQDLVLARARAERVTELLVDVFAAPDPENAQGKALSALDVLQRGEHRLRERLASDPSMRAALLHTLGAVYEGLGSYDRAAAALSDSLATRRSLEAPEGEVGETLAQLAEVRLLQGDFVQATSLSIEAGALLQRAGKGRSRRAIQNQRMLGVAYLDHGELERGAETLRTALALQREIARGPEIETIAELNALAMAHMYRGEDRDARSLLEEGVSIAHALGDPAEPDVINVFATLAVMLTSRDDVPPEAIELERKALARRRELYGERHPFVALDLANLAFILTRAGQWAEAERLAGEALALQETVLGPRHPDSVVALTSLGRACEARGDHAQAETYLRRALDVGRRAQPDGPGPITPCLDLGRVLLSRGRVSEAGSTIEDCSKRCAQRYGAENWHRAEAETVRAEWLAAAGRSAEAYSAAEHARAMLARELGPDHLHTRAAAQLSRRLSAARVDVARSAP